MSPEDRTKIVRIIARLNIGGPALHVVNLNRGLSSDRFESLLVLPAFAAASTPSGTAMAIVSSIVVTARAKVGSAR